MNQERILTAFSDSLQAARRRERLFLVIGGVWMFALVAVVLFSSIAMNRLEDQYFNNSEAINRNIGELAQYRLELQELRSTLHTQRDSLNRLETSLIETLSQEQRVIYLRSVAEAVVSRATLTNQEEQLLEQLSSVSETLDDTVSLYLNGVAQMQQGEYTTAIDALTRSIELDSSNPEAHTALGQAYAQIDRYADAVDEFSFALDLLGRNDAVILTARCGAGIQLGELDQAISDCDSASELAPEYFLPHHYRGFANYLKDRLELAQIDWEAAGNLRSESARSLENVGLIYLRQRNWQAASDHAMRLNSDDSNREWNWLFLWIALDKQGQTEQAENALAQLRRIQPDLDSVKVFLDDDLIRDYVDRYSQSL